LASNTGRCKWQDTEMRLARASGAQCAVESMAPLRSGRRGKGGRVKSQRQAIAIGLSEARQAVFREERRRNDPHRANQDCHSRRASDHAMMGSRASPLRSTILGHHLLLIVATAFRWLPYQTLIRNLKARATALVGLRADQAPAMGLPE